MPSRTCRCRWRSRSQTVRCQGCWATFSSPEAKSRLAGSWDRASRLWAGFCYGSEHTAHDVPAGANLYAADDAAAGAAGVEPEGSVGASGDEVPAAVLVHVAGAGQQGHAVPAGPDLLGAFQSGAGGQVAEQLAIGADGYEVAALVACLLYTSPSPRDGLLSRMPSS